jgi:hypothetical protein
MSKRKRSAVREFLSKEAASESAAELRAQVRVLERQVRGLRTKEATIIEAVRQALAESPPRLSAPPAPKRSRSGKYEEIAVLHVSDTQCGKITRSYDTTVCEERVLACVEKTAYIADLRRSIARIDELHLYLGGDMVEGEEIFPHQAHEIDSSVFEQAVVNFPRIAVKAILAALSRFPRVKVFTVAGNHGRNGPRHTRAHPKTNWDNVAYEVTRALLLGSKENPRTELASRLDFRIADEFWIVDRVFDWGNLMVHGHQIGGGFAGFPWYGAGKKAWGWIDTIEEKWDNLLFGHFHTAAMATLNMRRFYANGTTESDNTFAKEQLAACGDPCQRLLFMDAKHGVVSDTLLYLAARQPNSKR